jgi:hypothetical protein
MNITDQLTEGASMGKQLQSKTAIVKQSQPQSLTLNQQRTALIGEYLYKYAAIDRNRVVDEELITIFVEGLSGLDEKELERGLKNYLKEGKRFPWPSEIIELSDLS